MLEQLADVLKRRKPEWEPFICGGKNLWGKGDLWCPGEENPSVAFALLDLLEEWGHHWEIESSRRRDGLYSIHVQHLDARIEFACAHTRTEAIVKAVIEAAKWQDSAEVKA